MAKKIMSDILVSKKSIRQIPLSKEKDIEYKDLKKEAAAPSWGRKPLNPKFVIWLIAIICILALFFGISIVFSKATVIVTPRTEKITFNNDTYTAKSASSTVDSLSFEVLKVKQTAGETVEAIEEKQVSQKALGTIVVYNNYSPSPQRLINNTRFEANNGKIYRISSSIIVPGFKKSGDKITPGSIEANIFADQAGEDYNLKLSDLAGDFKIPGFKGDLRYQGFYARLKTDIALGFVGNQKVISDTLRKTTESLLKEKIKEQLLKELYAIKPESYLIFKDGYSIDYSNLPDTAVEGGKVKISLEGDLSAIVFNNLKLTKYMADKKIDNFDGLPAELIPTDNLTVTMTGADNTGLWKNNTLQVKLRGDAIIKWQYDGDALKKDLAGKSQSDLNSIISKYKDSILGIKIHFVPVWARYFPDNLNKIKIEEAV